MDRTERVRSRAHQIWDAEGQPSDRCADHWSRAEREVDDEPAPDVDKATCIGPAGDAAGVLAQAEADGDDGVRDESQRTSPGGGGSRDQDDASRGE